MERLPENSGRVVGLAALLSQPRPIQNEDGVDPAAELQKMRDRTLELAQREGYARGMELAAQEIADAKAAASAETIRSVQRAHAEETERLATSNRRLSELLEALGKADAEQQLRVEEQVLEITYASVIRLIGDIGVCGEVLSRICQKALDEYRQRPLMLKVAEEDLGYVHDLASSTITVEMDGQLSPGECRLHTHKGDYYTSLELRLEGLKQAFLRTLTKGERA